jgi:peptide-methionine (S)-S-oxide reductase
MKRTAFVWALAIALSIAGQVAIAQSPRALATATLAGGCFWCVEADFDKLEGVISTTSGYAGGQLPNPTYEQISTGRTGHFEVVQIVYDPARITYAQLLDHFWINIDPTVDDRQFCDVGPQYRAAIFVHDEEQRRVAEASKAALQKKKPFAQPIVTPILPAAKFYPAETYHQDYYKKNPVRYRYYRAGCGRDARLRELWGNAAR